MHSEVDQEKSFRLIQITMEYVGSDDRISDLPWEILDNILGRLPINTTVSTTILSTKWRDKWNNISKLVFDDYSIDPHSTDSDKLARIVNSVLLSHRGTIQTFIFTTQSPFSNPDIDIWISFLRKSGVKELQLDFSDIYTLPPCFFSFGVLKHLSLTNCWLELPHKFTAFKGLVSLELNMFSAVNVIQEIINNCPNLEKLVLSEICFEFLFTYVPKLTYFHVEGEFKSVDLQNSPHLTDVIFKMTTEADTSQQLSNFKVQLPAWISLIRKLTLSGYFLRYLAARCIWRGINIVCDKVEVIELDGLHFDHLEEMSLTFSILVCSSNLKELRIRGSGPINKDFTEFAEGLAQVSCCFNQLRVVKIEITRYDEKDEIEGSFLDMVKLLLAHSPVVEEVDVHYTHSEKSDMWFKNELMKLERASSKLKLQYTSTHVPYRVPRPQQVFDDDGIDWFSGVNYGYW